jgi:ABC-type glycerol-3-phosphate transport system substrate-binding protein
MLSTGKAAMAIGWPGWYVSADQWTVGFMALSGRANPSSAAYNSNVYGIWTLGVADSSMHKEEAVALLQYLMDPEVQLDSVEAGGVPCRYSVLTNQEVLRFHPEYEEICNALESGQYRPIMTEWNDFLEILGRYLEAIMKDEVTPQKGLMAAEDELQELMK